MFQRPTFDPATIDRELSLARAIGMNTMRIFLHDLLFDDPPVFFDNVDSGKQEDPIPGVHNSRWVKSPGLAALRDPTQYARLETYVRSVIRRFGADPRVLAFDMWNEPDNGMSGEDLAAVKFLLPATFKWARDEGVTHPLTTGVWEALTFSDFQLQQIELSDFITFHAYSSGQHFEATIKALRDRFDRPIVCTEWLARPLSVPAEILPIAKREKVGVINWGLVDGKMQTKYPWDSVGHPYDHEPDPWFHDLFHKNGTPYNQDESDLFKRITR
ncbi:hypothetical protein HDU83_004827 [Entophlyctis luteolus]|nr:hypothetical protein HDU83_004827 [Entophlyctis luteolus]